MKTKHKIINGDSRKMNLLSDESVHLIVTSPPYWQLKDYGTENQIGYHESYEDYINNLNLVWNECNRVLHQGCRLCINIGDQFARAVYYGRYKVIPIRTEIIKFCETIGFDYMGAVIWQKTTTTNTTGGAVVMGCLTGDTQIYTTDGYKTISQIKINENVFCFNEKKREIETGNCTDKWYKGENDIYELKTSHRKIRATSNHLFLVLRTHRKVKEYCLIDKKAVQTIRKNISAARLAEISEKYNFKPLHLKYKLKHLKESFQTDLLNDINMLLNNPIQPVQTRKITQPLKTTLEWVPLKDLQKGDFIIVPENLECEKIDSLFQTAKEFGFDLNTYNLNDFCEIIGLFIGDGCIAHSRQNNDKQILIAMYNESKNNLFPIYKEKIRRVFDLNAWSGEDGLMIASVRLSRFLKKLDLDHKAKEKHLPSWIFQLPNQAKISLLRGYVDADGSVEKNRGRITITSSSLKLIRDTKVLLDFLGIQSSNIIQKYSKANYLVKKDTLSYCLRFSISQGAFKIGSNDRKYCFYNPSKFTDRFEKLKFNLKGFKLDKIESIAYAGQEEVFDISIDKNANMIANGMIVHNSYPFPRNGILKIDYEFILIFKKQGNPPKPDREQKALSAMSREEWNRYFSGHWNFSGVRQEEHLAMFPEELPSRLIKMFSFTGETVLDPFLGSGTTSLAAKNLQRNSVGYEINPEFIEIIKQKLNIYQSDITETEYEFLKESLKSDLKKEIANLPYIFKDPHKFDRKVNPEKIQ